MPIRRKYSSSQPLKIIKIKKEAVRKEDHPSKPLKLKKKKLAVFKNFIKPLEASPPVGERQHEASPPEQERDSNRAVLTRRTSIRAAILVRCEFSFIICYYSLHAVVQNADGRGKKIEL